MIILLKLPCKMKKQWEEDRERYCIEREGGYDPEMAEHKHILYICMWWLGASSTVGFCFYVKMMSASSLRFTAGALQLGRALTSVYVQQ